MASSTHLRFRRSAAQLQALAEVEREIRANDHNGHRKYLQAFSNAFRRYECVLDPPQLRSLVNHADVLLVGDYHALPACQRYAASLFEERCQPGDRPVVLGVETIFSRDQHILDEWWRREIDEQELKQRIRYDLDWGYDWSPFYELLVTAREHGDAIYGMDCMPREDLRKISARDRHAVHKLAEIRQRHPNAVILVLFGESHLAPDHLPRVLRATLSQERVLTVLQNVDPLYWHAAGEKCEQVDAVRVADDVVCVFNSTPLEKYENYRLCLTRWRQEDGPDVGPTIYNLIDGLVRFLSINRYSSRNGTQPKFLIDLLPEVCCRPSDAQLRRSLSRRSIAEGEQQWLFNRIEERGSAYVPQTNTFYVREFQMMYAAEEAARFLHHACRGLPARFNGHCEHTTHPGEIFFAKVVEYALGYCGSRILCPPRPPVRGADVLSFSGGEILESVAGSESGRSDSAAQQFGYLLGSDLYDAYIARRVTPAMLRRLFLALGNKSAGAKQLCLQLAAKEYK